MLEDPGLKKSVVIVRMRQSPAPRQRPQLLDAHVDHGIDVLQRTRDLEDGAGVELAAQAAVAIESSQGPPFNNLSPDGGETVSILYTPLEFAD